MEPGIHGLGYCKWDNFCGISRSMCALSKDRRKSLGRIPLWCHLGNSPAYDLDGRHLSAMDRKMSLRRYRTLADRGTLDKKRMPKLGLERVGRCELVGLMVDQLRVRRCGGERWLEGRRERRRGCGRVLQRDDLEAVLAGQPCRTRRPTGRQRARSCHRPGLCRRDRVTNGPFGIVRDDDFDL